MSEESATPDPVELLGRALEAANRRDVDAVASSFAEDATVDGRALGDHFEGRAAIRKFVEEWFGTYEELQYELEEVRDLGHGVVFAVVVQNGRPVGSAGQVRQREGWVIVWEGGLIAHIAFSEVDEARADAERLAEQRGAAMSQENVEVVRRFIEASRSGDVHAVEAFLAISDPSIEHTRRPDAFGPETYRGYDGVRRWFTDMADLWREWRTEIEDLAEVAPDTVAARVRFIAVGRDSGVEVEARLGLVCVVSEGRVLRSRTYASGDEALKAVGLEE